jgi:hypothetical protein
LDIFFSLVLNGTVLSRSALCFPVTCSPRFRLRLSSGELCFRQSATSQQSPRARARMLVHHQTCRQAVEAFGPALHGSLPGAEEGPGDSFARTEDKKQEVKGPADSKIKLSEILFLPSLFAISDISFLPKETVHAVYI